MSGNKSLVSVIIPSYNHEKYIAYTINSVINQTYKNIELIVVDDGSKDNTLTILDELRNKCTERFTRVHFEAKENEGTCKTLNKLLSLAQGDYIYLIASDDMVKPEAIEKFVDFLDNHPEYSLVVGDNEIIDFENKVCYWDKKRNLQYSTNKAKYKTFVEYLKKDKSFNFNSSQFGTYETLYCGNYIPNGYLIRKSIFEKIGNFTPEAPLEDYWLMLQISKYSKMKYIDKVLFSYRWHQANTVKNDDKMVQISTKTKQYEGKLLKQINLDDVNSDVLKVIKNGAVKKRIGIKGFFEILTVVKDISKYRQFLLFNLFKITFKIGGV